MNKELLKEIRSLLRDFELHYTGTAKALPILERDFDLLKRLIKELE